MSALSTAFTEANGKGSSSRILTGLMYAAITTGIVHHAWISGQWPDAGTLLALATFAASPYAINSGTKAVTAVSGKPLNVATTAAADTVPAAAVQADSVKP